MKSPEKRALLAAKTRAWYKANFRKARTTQLLRHYGITFDQYEMWSEAFGNVCHICSKPCPTKRRLAVDHDHNAGLVRGLLCLNCNKGLGNFKDNTELMLKAIDYLNYAKGAKEYVDNALNKRFKRESIQGKR